MVFEEEVSVEMENIRFMTWAIHIFSFSLDLGSADFFQLQFKNNFAMPWHWFDNYVTSEWSLVELYNTFATFTSHLVADWLGFSGVATYKSTYK